MSAQHGAIGNRDILARNAQFTCLQVTSGFDGDAVAAYRNVAVADVYVLTRLRVDAVRIGEGTLWMVMPLMVTLSQNSGFTVQKGELIIFTPSTRTFLQRMGCMKGDGRNSGPMCRASLRWFRRKGLSGRFPSRTWAGTC